jgi:hypothetical protein
MSSFVGRNFGKDPFVADTMTSDGPRTAVPKDLFISVCSDRVPTSPFTEAG